MLQGEGSLATAPSVFLLVPALRASVHRHTSGQKHNKKKPPTLSTRAALNRVRCNSKAVYIRFGPLKAFVACETLDSGSDCLDPTSAALDGPRPGAVQGRRLICNAEDDVELPRPMGSTGRRRRLRPHGECGSRWAILRAGGRPSKPNTRVGYPLRIPAEPSREGPCATNDQT